MRETRDNPPGTDLPGPVTGRADRESAFRSLAGRELQDLMVRCNQELRHRALLLDPERVCELSALRIAAGGGEASGEAREQDGERAGGGSGTSSQVDDWISRRITAAIEQARREDRERAQETPGSRSEEDYRFLLDVFFVPPGHGAIAAHAFNRLPRSTRRATLELLLHGRSIEDCLAEGLAENREQLGDRARTGLLAIMQIDEAMLTTKKRKKPRGKEREA